MTNDGLLILGERSEALQQLENGPDHTQKTQPTHSIRTDSQAHAQCETSTRSPERTTEGGKKRMAWTRSIRSLHVDRQADFWIAGRQSISTANLH
jgi:hypothetical protein